MNLSLEHQGRELVHCIAMLLQCLRTLPATAVQRRGWWRAVRQSRVDLEALYAAGLTATSSLSTPGGRGRTLKERQERDTGRVIPGRSCSVSILHVIRIPPQGP